MLLGFAAWALLRKQLRDAQNTALLRGRRANKVAVQRFRAAKRHMAAGDRRAFYEEMLSALWGYMSDRFNIPAASLTKESVREELHRRASPLRSRSVSRPSWAAARRRSIRPWIRRA